MQKSESESHSPTLCDPMDYTVHRILQARILEWVAIPFSRGSSQPGIKPRSPTLQWILYQLSHQGKYSVKYYVVVSDAQQI